MNLQLPQNKQFKYDHALTSNPNVAFVSSPAQLNFLYNLYNLKVFHLLKYNVIFSSVESVLPDFIRNGCHSNLSLW